MCITRKNVVDHPGTMNDYFFRSIALTLFLHDIVASINENEIRREMISNHFHDVIIGLVDRRAYHHLRREKIHNE